MTEPALTDRGASLDVALVARSAELAIIDASIRDPRVSGVVILGAAGTGRSRLLREVHHLTRASGRQTVELVATDSAATLPLGALRELLSGVDPSLGGLAFMNAAARVLAERADDAPSIVTVDDADLLDPASAALLLELTRRRVITTIATVRARRRSPDAVAALTREPSTAVIALDEYDERAVGDLVEAFAGGPVDRLAAHRAARATGSNAVYLRALVQDATRSGALCRVDGLWTLLRPLAPGPALERLVYDDLHDLDAPEREAVELVALAGWLGGRALEELGAAEAASGAQDAGLLASDRDRVTLTRPLLGEVLRETLALPRTRTLRARLIAVLGQDPHPVDDARARLARLRRDAGLPIDESQALLAARAAFGDSDDQSAAELARLALASRRSVEAALVLARAQRRLGDEPEAARTLAAVEDLAPGHAEVCAYARERVTLLFWGLRRCDEASALVQRMTEWPGDASWRRLSTALQRGYDDRAGRCDGVFAEGLGVSEGGAEDEADERSAHARRIRNRLATLLAGHGDDAADDAFSDLPFPGLADDLESANLVTLVFVALESGNRWADLEPLLHDVVAAAARVHQRAAAGIAAFGLARLLSMQGRYRDAGRWLVEADVHLSRHDPFNTIIGVRCLAIGIAVSTRDFEGAGAARAALDASMTARSPLSTQRPLVALAESREASLTHPSAAARRLLVDAEALARDLPGLAPTLAYEALRLGHPAAPAAIERLCAGCRSRLVTAFARHGRARRARDPAGLLEVADEMGHIGAHGYAVDIASEAASMFLDQGRHDSARRAAAKARDHFAPNQGAELPLIDGLHGIATELTPRQSQIVELARLGLSNAEIAARLEISPRTAETHLYHSMQKLGINTRRDL